MTRVVVLLALAVGLALTQDITFLEPDVDYDGEYNPCKVDLMIVMDVSGSITEDTDFQNEKDFILQVLEYPTNNWYLSGRLKVGIVKFTTSAEVILDIATSTRESAIEVMTGLTSEGGGTSAMSGIELALSEIRRNRRPHAQVVIFHVSDGNSGATDVFESVERLGKTLQDEGIIGFSMTFSSDAYLEELEAYAGSADRVYQGNLGPQALLKFTEDVLAVTANVEFCGPVVSTTVAPTTAAPATTTAVETTTLDFQFDPCKVDLMIVMDVSGSITEDEDFQKQKAFILQILDFPTDEWYLTEKLQVGIVKFTTSAEILLPFGKESKNSSIDIVAALTSEGGGTSALSGIRLALQEIRQHRRPDSQVVLIHVSDGNSGDLDNIEEVKRLGKSIKEEGIIGFSMTFSTDAYVPELEAYAGDAERVYRGDFGLDALADFQADVLAVTANLRVCGPIQPTPAPITTLPPVFDPCVVDLMIVMDVSGSITEDADFQNQKEFVLQVLNFPTDIWYQSARLKVGVVKFTTTAEIVLPFGESSKGLAVDTVAALTSEGGGTSALSGIRLALQEIRQHRRPDAQVVLMHVSDGNSGALDNFAQVKALGQTLKSEGILGFSMTFSTDAYEPELEAYAGDADRVYRGDFGPDALVKFQEDVLAVTANVELCGKVPTTIATTLAPTTQAPTTTDEPTTIDFQKDTTTTGYVAPTTTKGYVDPNPTTTAAPVTEPPTTISFQVDPCTVDLMIVMDVSGSITEDTDFENEKNFILEVLDFPTEEWYQGGRLNVGVVKFTTTAEIVLPFGKSTRESALATVGALKSQGGGTSAMTGIRLALKEIRQHRRPEAQVVLLHVSDGNSGALDPIDMVKQLGEELKQEGIIAFSMTYSTDAYEPELAAYAGSEDRVYRGDYGRQELAQFQLDVLSVVANVEKCGGNPTTSPPVTTLAPTSGVPVYNPCKVDLMVIMDVSGSITEDTDFEKEKAFILQVLNFPTEEYYADGRLNVGVVKFTTTADIVLEYGTSNKADAIASVTPLTSQGGGTSAMTGVQLALAQIRAHRRPDAQVVLLHVSDGNSGVNDPIDQVVALGKTLQEEGIIGFSMTFSTDAYEPELEAYAGHDDRVYRGDYGPEALIDFQVDVLDIVANLDNCGGETTTSGPTKAPTTAFVVDTTPQTTTEAAIEITKTTAAPTTAAPSTAAPTTAAPTTAAPTTAAPTTAAPTTVAPTTAAPVTAGPSVPTGDCPIDLVIILDTSGSVEEEFERQRAFVLAALDVPTAADYADRLQVSIITFYSQATLVKPFGQLNKEGHFQLVQDIKHTGGSTSALTGLRMAMRQIEEGHRPGAQLFVMHVSDGNSQDFLPLIKAAGRQLRETGAEVFSVTYSSDWYLPELSTIAGSDRRVYVDEGGRLTKLESDILDILATSACSRDSTPPPVTNRAVCTSRVMIVMDASGSVRSAFEDQRAFVRKVFSFPEEKAYQTGAVTLALTRFTLKANLDVPFSNSQNKTAALDKISAVKFNGGGTSALSGMRIALAEIKRYQAEPRETKLPRMALVLVSDGRSGLTDTFPEMEFMAQELYNNGVTVFAVTFSKDYYLPELTRYAGSAERVYTGDRLEDFQKELLAVAYPQECRLTPTLAHLRA